jgi:hypothetical protein
VKCRLQVDSYVHDEWVKVWGYIRQTWHTHTHTQNLYLWINWSSSIDTKRTGYLCTKEVDFRDDRNSFIPMIKDSCRAVIRACLVCGVVFSRVIYSVQCTCLRSFIIVRYSVVCEFLNSRQCANFVESVSSDLVLVFLVSSFVRLAKLRNWFIWNFYVSSVPDIQLMNDVLVNTCTTEAGFTTTFLWWQKIVQFWTFLHNIPGI